ncbi:MAG: hypothetical protein IKR85_08845 [Clostridia bacterium]|nr:hypothetical protein [Clostridia bacterium]
MKHTFVILLMLALAFCAVSAENTVGMPNPVTECASLEEINALVGSNLVHPAVMGVTDERFCIIDTGDSLIAEYSFRINSYECTMRCAAVADEDISGVYIGGEAAFADEFEGEIQFAAGEGLRLARWFDINGQYCFVLSDPEEYMDEETFRLVALEMKDLTSTVPTTAELEAFYAALEGAYEDSYSQRAHLTVSANGSEGASIEVDWADSAFEYVRWTMTVKLGEDGLLYYTDCTKEQIGSDDSEHPGVNLIYEGGEGFFGLSEGKLFWNGAEEESCRECVFER